MQTQLEVVKMLLSTQMEFRWFRNVIFQEVLINKACGKN